MRIVAISKRVPDGILVGVNHRDPRADINDGLFVPRPGRVQACAPNDLKSEYVALDNAVKADTELPKRQTGGSFNTTSGC